MAVPHQDEVKKQKALIGSMDDNSNASSCSKDDQDEQSVLDGVIDMEFEVQAQCSGAVESDQPIDWSNPNIRDRDNKASIALLAQEPFEDIQEKDYPPPNPPLGYPVAGLPGTDTTLSINLGDTTVTSNNGARGQPTLDTNNYKPPIRPSPEDNRPDPVSNGQEQTRRRKRVSVYRNPVTKSRYVSKKYLGKPREREIEVLNILHHKSIPKLYNVEADEYCTVLKMEYCGKPLSSYVNNFYDKGYLVPESRIWEILEQLLDVLKYLEAAKVMSRNITEETVCIQQDTRKGLVMKLVGFGKVLTYQDLPAPDQAMWDTDMPACGRLALFMVYGPWVQFPKNENDFPDIYSYNLRRFILKMVDKNLSGMSPCTGLQEIYRICKPLSSYVKHFYDKGCLVPESCILEILEQLLDVLKYLEAAKVMSRNITEETVCIQQDNRKGLVVNLVGFGKVLTYQDLPAPDQAMWDTDMAACGRLALFMVYGPWVQFKVPKNENDFPDIYSYKLRRFILKMVDKNSSGMSPCTGLEEIYRIRQQETIVLSSDSEEEQHESSSSMNSQSSSVGDGGSVNQDYQSSSGGDGGQPEVIELLSDTDEGLPKSSSKVQLANQPTSAEISLTSAVKVPQKQISFLNTVTSAALPMITPPSQPSNPDSTNRDPRSGFDLLQGHGPIGTHSSRPHDVIAVNLGNGNRTRQAQASTVTLGKLKSHVMKNKVHQEKPYIRPQTEFNNLPDFEKIEGTNKMKKSVSTDSVEQSSCSMEWNH